MKNSEASTTRRAPRSRGPKPRRQGQAADTRAGSDLPTGPDLGLGEDLRVVAAVLPGEDLPREANRRFGDDRSLVSGLAVVRRPALVDRPNEVRAGSARVTTGGMGTASHDRLAAPLGPTGADLLAIAHEHLKEDYRFGARAPMADPTWKGPWDCAEFVSWCVFQASGVLFGTEPRDDALLADAYTGYWWQHARGEIGSLIDWRAALTIPGAALLRRPVGRQIGHIAFSDGLGGTVEAHSTARGVTVERAEGRRWDAGVLVPGVRYVQANQPVAMNSPGPTVLRLAHPPMQGERVRAVQEALNQRGFHVGPIDGLYGPQTAHAVQMFQLGATELVADGEVGPLTANELGLPWPNLAVAVRK